MSASMFRDHDRIRELVAELRGYTVADGVPIDMCFASARWALTRELIRHMALEGRFFQERGLEGRATAASSSIAGFEQAYRAHVGRWTSRDIDDRWRDYCQDLRGLLDTLDERMTFEEREIYPRIADVVETGAARARAMAHA